MQIVKLTEDITIHLLDTDFDYFFVVNQQAYFSSEFSYDLEKIKLELADVSDCSVDEITPHDVTLGICWEHVSRIVAAKYPHMINDYFWDRLACTLPLC